MYQERRMPKSQQLYTKVCDLNYVDIWSLTSNFKHDDVCDVRNVYWKSRDRRQQRTSPESSFSSRISESPNLAVIKDLPGHSASSSENDYRDTSEAVTWPPSGLTQRSELIACDAELLICKGACGFEGYVSVMPNNSNQYRCYAFAGTPENEKVECHDTSSSVGVTGWTTLTLANRPGTVNSWDTLEQPSMLLCFGTTPGTITLNQWAGLCNLNTPSETSAKSAVEPREINLLSILHRISLVQRGIESDVSVGVDKGRGTH